ncbi:MAG: beta-ketoacyl-[acyl-carrier-protein] synthase family protein [Bacteroidales bacterium]
MKRNRVVITGMGIVSPIGNNIHDFTEALFSGKSGVMSMPELADYGFKTLLGAIPEENESIQTLVNRYQLNKASDIVKHSLSAALEAWVSAGFHVPEDFNNSADADTGAIIGTGMGAVDTISDHVIPNSSPKNKRRLRSTIIEENMPNAPAAHVSMALGLGNRVSANSSACATGTEAIITAAERIAGGKAERMLAGGSEAFSPYAWIGFDIMRVLAQKKNEIPQLASCPLSEHASGFVSGAGAGIVLLESYQSAKNRGAKILAEYAGGYINSGGMRDGGSMTAPSSKAVIQCIKGALQDAAITPGNINYVNGHLSSTMADVLEIQNISKALGIKGKNFPFINSLKAQTGHCIGAAGSVETIGGIIQMQHDKIAAAINSRPLHPDIASIGDEKKIAFKTINCNINYMLKTSFGFGDVNTCLILKKSKN